ncbi:MAG: methyltransferase domain-containing protein [Holophagaceae bacterium]|nr:methyltransferase domain-containing protein [Holophagaceae bacterium]
MKRDLVYHLGAPFYDLAMAGLMRGIRRESIASLKLAPGEKLLIPGIGTGLDLPFLPRDVDVLGGDLVPAMLARAGGRRARLGLANVRLAAMDAQALPLHDAGFDAALLHLIVAVAPDGHAVLAEACRVLKPGGRLAVVDKFLPDGQARVPFWRKGLQALVLPFTDINRRFGDLVAGLPLRTISDQGVMLGRTFRSILLERQ